MSKSGHKLGFTWIGRAISHRRLKLLIVLCSCLVLSLAGVMGWRIYRRYLDKAYYASLPIKQTNLSYCNGEKLDLFVPRVAGPVPVIIYIHGGGWQYGSKIGGSVETMKNFTKYGFAVASINYRLSGKAKFPAQINDVYCAVRFLRHNSQKFGLDKAKIGVIGHSAGGHLAALAATASDQAGFTVGGYQEESSRIQAAVSLSGHMDLSASDLTPVTQQYIRNLLGQTVTKAQASPITYVDESDPPLLLIHGQKDNRVPINQATNFYNFAQTKAANIQYFAVKNANHNLQPAYGLLTPVSNQWLEQVISFFEQNLLTNTVR